MISNNVNGVCQDKENINPLSSLAVENEGETVNCISCNEHIDKNSTYCPVCGIKQSGE